MLKVDIKSTKTFGDKKSYSGSKFGFSPNVQFLPQNMPDLLPNFAKFNFFFQIVIISR
jgi:hypothetical protein